MSSTSRFGNTERCLNTKYFLAHLSRSDKASFCDRSSSVVRPLFVRSFTIDFNHNF